MLLKPPLRQAAKRWPQNQESNAILRQKNNLKL